MLVFGLQLPLSSDNSNSNSGKRFTEKEMDRVREMAKAFASNNDKIGIHLCCIIEHLFNAKCANEKDNKVFTIPSIPEFGGHNRLNDPSCHIDIAVFLQLALLHKVSMLHEASHEIQPILSDLMFGDGSSDKEGVKIPMAISTLAMHRNFLAYALAEYLLDGVVDKQQKPLIYHCIRVAETCRKNNLSHDQQIAAILHDAIEDGDVTNKPSGTPSDILHYLDIIKLLFGSNVEKMVLALTKYPGQMYDNYIKQLADSCPEAIPIKLADIADNLDPSRGTFEEKERLVKRYCKARRYLIKRQRQYDKINKLNKLCELKATLEQEQI